MSFSRFFQEMDLYHLQNKRSKLCRDYVSLIIKRNIYKNCKALCDLWFILYM